MTLETLFDEDFHLRLNKWKEDNSIAISTYTLPVRPTAISDLYVHLKQLDQMQNTVMNIVLRPMQYDVSANLAELESTVNTNRESSINEIKDEISNRKHQIMREHESHNAEVKSYNDNLTKHMEERHATLQAYKKDLAPVFQRYNITPMSMAISDDCTEKEFMQMLDASIQVCNKYATKRSHNLNMIFDPIKTMPPLNGLLILFGIMLGVYFLSPVIAIAVFGFLFYNIMNVSRDTDKLKLARALMAEVNYKRFVPEDAFKNYEAPPDLVSIDNEGDERINKLKADGEYNFEELHKGVEAYQTKLNQEASEACNELRKRLDSLIELIAGECTECNKLIDNAKDSYKPFPSVCNESVCMSRIYTLGRLYDIADVTVRVPEKNIVFALNENNREQIVNMCKLYLCNALLSVQVRTLDITFYDPVYQGSEFAEFFSQDTTEYIKIAQKEFNETLKEFREFVQNNIKTLKHKSIDEFNAIAEKEDRTSKPYKMLIVVSGLKNMESSATDKKEPDEVVQLREFIRHSRENGVLVWIIDDHEFPDTLIVDGSYMCNKGTPIQYTLEIGEKAMEVYENELKIFKPKPLLYKEKFGDKFIPRDKWWTWDTIKGIELNFGLMDGDPTKGLPVMIGDNNVHAIMGGATGSGKSAAINQMLISLITKYPPSELNIVYVDFKNVEAAKFTRGKTTDGQWFTDEQDLEYKKNSIYHKRYSVIPHLHIISGTTDGEYALSLFEFMMNEMARRQKIISKFGVPKIEDVRTDILKKYNAEHNTPKGTWYEMRQDWDWYKTNVLDEGLEVPRLLVIFDEFQVMFNPQFIDNKTIDAITGKITALTKLARAMSCHLWFTSQSMKGTMSKDTMGNFSLRAALRCAEDTSQDLLGNKAASEIKQKQGYMYTNDSGGENKDANRFWRVPFLPNDDMEWYMHEIPKLLDSHHEKHRNAEFFDEKVMIPSNVIDEWYELYPDLFKPANVLVLGERAAYSENKAPVTVKLQRVSGENLLIYGFNLKEYVNNTLTIADNCRLSDGTLCIFNIQDREASKMIDIEQYVDPRFRSLNESDQDLDELVESLDEMITNREQAEELKTTVFVFLVNWEKADGVFMSVRRYKTQDAFKTLLVRGPAVGVHFVMTVKDKLELPNWLSSLCNHKLGSQTTKDVYFFSNTNKVEKLPTPEQNAGSFAIYECGSTNMKFKIYQHEFKELETREVIL